MVPIQEISKEVILTEWDVSLIPNHVKSINMIQKDAWLMQATM